MLTSEMVKEAALSAGADLVGIGDMARFEGVPAEMDPRAIFPEARTVIGMAFRIPRGVQQGIEQGTQFYQYPSMAYGGINEIFAPAVLYHVGKMIEDHGYEAAVYRNTGARGVVSDMDGSPGNTLSPEEQIEVNVQAAEKLAALHDALKEFGYEGHELELYLVRILFCLFADDTGIFPKDSFFNYVENSREDGSDLNMRLGLLFDVLNKAPNVRAKQEALLQKQGLFQFPYVNGGLFAQTLSFPVFNDKMRKVLLECCNFNWNKISPAIFGAMFQGVMDKNARRELGAHYTSEENILKLINSLFMDDLRAEFERVKSNAGQLDRFHKKISEMKFLDPACGCGNFLIVTYQHLRLLELDILRMKQKSGQLLLDISELLKVNVSQFYGIEIEDFPCQIAQVGMWLMFI